MAGHRDGSPLRRWLSARYRDMEEFARAGRRMSVITRPDSTTAARTEGLPRAGLIASAPGRLDALTSLRFVFAMMVFIHHTLQFVGGAWPAFGLQGVSYFFVLSGFVLRYATPRIDGQAAARRFVLLRFWRIWPLHITCLAASLLLVDGDRAFALQHPDYLLYHVALLQAWIPIQPSALGMNWPAWSISTELCFYLLFPIIVSLRHLARAAALSAVLVIFFLTLDAAGCRDAHAFASQPTNPGLSCFMMVYVFPASRLIEFCAGIWAHDIFAMLRQGGAPSRRDRVAWTCLEACAVLLVAMLLIWPPEYAGTPVQHWLAIVAPFPIAGILFIIFALQRGFISVALTRRRLVYLGEISFALYLTHTVVIRFASERGWLSVSHSYAGVAGVLTATLIVSALAFRFVETPIRVAARSRLRSGPGQSAAG